MVHLRKKALITGISGQDGSYLAELLLSKDYDVYGLQPSDRPLAVENIRTILPRIKILHSSFTNDAELNTLLKTLQPDEFYNLAGFSHVHNSWKDPVHVSAITAAPLPHFLEAIRQSSPKTRFYQASSSELFGLAQVSPQNEMTPFAPRAPYGVAKLFAHWMTVCYRQHHGLFAACGLLFNHESPRRGPEFVTRKISLGVAAIKVGKQQKLALGNLKAQRDWGFAGDHVRAIWAMLQQPAPEDFVIATNSLHSVEDFARIAFEHAGLDYREWVTTDESLFRPEEKIPLRGDYSKAERLLGWRPQTSFQDLVTKMVDADLASLRG